jgi:hypothetical protein
MAIKMNEKQKLKTHDKQNTIRARFESISAENKTRKSPRHNRDLCKRLFMTLTTFEPTVGRINAI